MAGYRQATERIEAGSVYVLELEGKTEERFIAGTDRAVAVSARGSIDVSLGQLPEGALAADPFAASTGPPSPCRITDTRGNLVARRLSELLSSAPAGRYHAVYGHPPRTASFTIQLDPMESAEGE